MRKLKTKYPCAQTSFSYAIAEKDQKIAALEQEIRTLKLNAENQKKAVGSLSSTAEKDDKTGFLGGLFM